MRRGEFVEGIYTGNEGDVFLPLPTYPDSLMFENESAGIAGLWTKGMPDGHVDVFDLDVSFLYDAPVLSIGTSSDKALKVSAFSYRMAGSDASYAGGEVAFTATSHDVVKSKFSSFLVSIASGGTVSITKAAADAETWQGAMANVPATPYEEIPLGYIIIGAGSTADWDATGHSLAGGGTTPANSTNYYPYTRGCRERVEGITKISGPRKGLQLGAQASLNKLGLEYTYRALYYS